MQSKFRKCFLVAPAQVDIEPIKNLLRSRHIDVYDTYDTPALGLPLSSKIAKAIKRSDFVIAVVSAKTPSANVFFELGLAYGADKPVFLLVQDEEPLPADISGMTYVRASPSDSEKIEFALDQFLKGYGAQQRKAIFAVKKPQRAGIDVASFQKDLEIIADQGNISRLTLFLANLLQSTGEVVQHHGPEEKGADMALWVDNLESSLGNPILVEVKMGRLSETLLADYEEQLRDYLAVTRTHVGVLVYLDRERGHFGRSRLKMPLVIRLDARELVSKLATDSLADILLTERNAVVHAKE